MKKNFPLVIFAIFSIFLLGGCPVIIQDNDLLEAPAVSEIGSGICLSIPRFSSETKYITIYRKDITSSSAEEATEVKLGLLYPSSYASNEASYIFEDIWLYGGHKYTYCVRYCEADKNYFSEWTEPISLATGKCYGSDTSLIYSAPNVKFRYNSSDITLKIDGNISNPQITDFATEWTPVLAVKSPTSTQVFVLNSVANETIISLRGLLSSEFFDCEIQVLGIAGQKVVKTTKDETEVVKQVIWTQPTQINIAGYTDNLLEIRSESATEGFDFS